MKDEKSTQEKLILATLACIEEEGMHSVTIRKIAKQANVNSAAISYHFGTKKELVERALQFSLDHSYADVKEIFEAKEDDPYMILKKLFIYLLDGAIRNPRITKAHFYNPFINNFYHIEIQEWSNNVFNLLFDKLNPLLPHLTEVELKYSISQMISVVMFKSFFTDFSKGFLKADLRDSKTQEEYINHLVNTFLRENRLSTP